MAYVAVTGGAEAIEASLDLLALRSNEGGSALDPADILKTLPDLVEQVQSESSLWAPEVAAVALAQAGGSVEEAVFLVRAYRSTLERLYTSRIIEPSEMRIDRRISSAFKDIPGGQILGSTRDYSHRLIDFDLRDRTSEDVARVVEELTAKFGALTEVEGAGAIGERLPKVTDHLRELGLMSTIEKDDTPPVDTTKTPIAFPAPRSVRLQVLTRGLTQAVIAFGYAAIRGFGLSHPTIGELRHGTVSVTIPDPLGDHESEEDSYYLGAIPVCEVESLIPGDAGEDEERRVDMAIGYGLVYGNNESKAIAMSVLDHSLRADDIDFATQDQEFVLTHIDGVEATGFISHLKLPHYVTFQSKLDSARRSRKAGGE